VIPGAVGVLEHRIDQLQVGLAEFLAGLEGLVETARVIMLRILMRTSVCPPRAVGRDTSTSMV